MKNVLIISALAASSAMYGAIVIPGSGIADWHDVPAVPTFSGAGSTMTNATVVGAYWNNASDDNAVNNPPNCANIGCLLTGTGGFAAHVAPATPQQTDYLAPGDGAYLANASLQAVDFAIRGIPSGNVEIIAEYAGTGDRNWIGWYDEDFFTGANLATAFTAANSDRNGGSNHWGVIFTGFQTTGGTTAAFTPSATFGLWGLAGNFVIGDGQTPVYTGSVAQQTAIADQLNKRGLLTDTTKNGTSADVQGVLNPGGADGTCGINYSQPSNPATNGSNCSDVDNLAGQNTNAQHFAIFARSAAEGNALPVDYWIGFEDLRVNSANGTRGDRDYQDNVFKMRVVPEPGYYVLLSLGLAGLGLRRRMNKKSVS